MAEEVNFKLSIRTLYKYLKAFHHVRVMRGPEEAGTQPARMGRMARRMAGIARPAFPNTKTEWLGFGNAKNWLYTGTVILEGHYGEALKEARELVKVMPRDRWRDAWEVACKWAGKNLRTVGPLTMRLAKRELEQLLSGAGDAGLDMEVQEAGTGPHPGPSGPVDGDQRGRSPTRLAPQLPPLPQRERRAERGPVTNRVEPVPEAQPEVPLEVVTVQPQKEPQKEAEQDTGSWSDLGDSPLWFLELGEEWGQQVQEGAVGPKQPELVQPAKPVEVARKEIAPTKESMEGQRVLPPPPPRGADCSKHVRHDSRGDKCRNWELTPSRRVLILGASNMTRLPTVDRGDVEVHSFPGANLAHARYILKHKTRVCNVVRQVILAFGLNDRQQGDRDLVKGNLEGLREVAIRTFPRAEIHIPLINVCQGLPRAEIENVAALNRVIQGFSRSIPLLPADHFKTVKDKVHWTLPTGVAMLTHWLRHLKA
ncbi:MAG: hypothetical protein ACRDCE_07620 [Cetobacterium sp.]|uniref:hypothetical protein n=1 Tax=Cetobacterium sp. TaxID=2071632 RepID=UPI003EE819F9